MSSKFKTHPQSNSKLHPKTPTKTTIVRPTVLPQSAGYLGYWQLFIASTAFFNTIQNFTTLSLTKRLYGGKPEQGALSSGYVLLFCFSAFLTRCIYFPPPLSLVPSDHSIPEYSKNAVTHLQARTFAVWTLTSGMVRFYAAYNINNKVYVYFAPHFLYQP